MGGSVSASWLRNGVDIMAMVKVSKRTNVIKLQLRRDGKVIGTRRLTGNGNGYPRGAEFGVTFTNVRRTGRLTVAASFDNGFGWVVANVK